MRLIENITGLIYFIENGCILFFLNNSKDRIIFGIAKDIAVATAAPSISYKGIKIIFNPMFETILATLEYICIFTLPKAVKVDPFGPSITWKINPIDKIIKTLDAPMYEEPNKNDNTYLGKKNKIENRGKVKSNIHLEIST